MFETLKAAVRESGVRARHRREYRALFRLDDHILRDIGLPRDEVHALIVGRRNA